MRNREPTNNQNNHFELWQALLAIGATVLLFAACCSVPFILHSHLGIWFALAGAVVAMVCWVYLIRPMPGLIQGIVALSGLAALGFQLVFWIVKALHHVTA